MSSWFPRGSKRFIPNTRARSFPASRTSKKFAAPILDPQSSSRLRVPIQCVCSFFRVPPTWCCFLLFSFQTHQKVWYPPKKDTRIYGCAFKPAQNMGHPQKRRTHIWLCAQRNPTAARRGFHPAPARTGAKAPPDFCPRSLPSGPWPLRRGFARVRQTSDPKSLVAPSHLVP